MTNPTPVNPTPSAANAQSPDATARVIKRYGGRHLIFRTKKDGMTLLPRPYLLISSFKGAVWVFYGLGQIWITHKKIDQLEDWIVRSPRVRSARLKRVYQCLRPHLLEFIHFCNEMQLEGTLVLEPKVLEFHWTFGPEQAFEKHKDEHADLMEAQFDQLVSHFQLLQDESRG
jgi:hypothetical protein